MRVVQDEPVLAIRADDGFMHVSTAQALLEHVSEIVGDPSPQLEFYDGAGRQLHVVNGALEPMTVPDPAGGPNPVEVVADPQLLVDRIDVVLARTQVALDRAVAPLDVGGRPVRRIPRVSGELPVVLHLLSCLGGELESHANPGPATGWHAVYHLLGFRH
ncbi:MAG: hypothetical protein NTW05_14025 [Pseudonocardiales bacterium]|nr:hypothetical protein [Pseudonocardiales bacterium]